LKFIKTSSVSRCKQVYLKYRLLCCVLDLHSYKNGLIHDMHLTDSNGLVSLSLFVYSPQNQCDQHTKLFLVSSASSSHMLCSRRCWYFTKAVPSHKMYLICGYQHPMTTNIMQKALARHLLLRYCFHHSTTF